MRDEDDTGLSVEMLAEWDAIAENNLPQLAKWFAQEPNPELVGVKLKGDEDETVL